MIKKYNIVYFDIINIAIQTHKNPNIIIKDFLERILFLYIQRYNSIMEKQKASIKLIITNNEELEDKIFCSVLNN